MIGTLLARYIQPESVTSLHELFRERVRRSDNAVAYRYYDFKTNTWRERSWAQMGAEVARWQQALRREQLEPGDRVAIMLPNSCEWVCLDQAALGMGLVVVPLYVQDRGDNVGYILRDCDVKLLVMDKETRWRHLRPHCETAPQLQRVVALKCDPSQEDELIQSLAHWLPAPDPAAVMESVPTTQDALATIVYTSGTTGRPKGVMLSHKNILLNAWASLQLVPVLPSDSFLSFLPLSHMLERTAGYYIPMMTGNPITYARSVRDLREDLLTAQPTILVSVPRIFERVRQKVLRQLQDRPPLVRGLFRAAANVGWHYFLYQQGRCPWRLRFMFRPLLSGIPRKVQAAFGGRLRFAICGGAPLSLEVAKTFLGLGVTIIQGYGLTEHSPVISVNRLEDNVPDSVGEALPGVEIKLGDKQELQVRGASVMLGYWNLPKASAQTLDADGWLHTGDQARLEGRRIFITGRIKEIIVLSTGEKVPPEDMEQAITADPLFEQVMVLGEGRSYLSVLLVLDRDTWKTLRESAEQDLTDPAQAEALLLERIEERTEGFPGYARIRRAGLCSEAWSVENGLLTPTLKLKRKEIRQRYADLIEELYAGH